MPTQRATVSLAEFPSAVDAVQCAITVQERIAVVNEAIPAERRVTFRIGVHVGEAMVRAGDLFGDGVNIAARLQALAPPGAVCLSGTAHDYVHRMLPLAFEDLGQQVVKNLDAPVRAYLTRPSIRNLPSAVPFDHRRFEIYWARQLHSICMAAMDEIAKTVGLTGNGHYPCSLGSWTSRIVGRTSWLGGSASTGRRYGKALHVLSARD